DAAHGGGGIVSDARERADGGISLREPAGGGNLLRGTAQVARARVVAEAAPQCQHVVLGGGGQSRNGGESLEEAPVVRDHGLRARLLQHDLADPDEVRIASIAPWKIATAPGVPGKEEAARRAR